MKRYAITLITLFLVLQIQSQETTKKVGLFWDTSYSMIQKDLQKELQYLASYFSDHPNIDVFLTKFSNDIIFTKKYEIREGDWQNIKNELSNTVYDGSSSYKNIQVGENNEILLFTDGNESLDKLPQYFSKPTTIISSSPAANKKLLKNIATFSNGDFLDLSNITFEQTANKRVNVTGTVSDVVGALPNARVYSRETKEQAVTNDQGVYTIVAETGGVLEFRAEGKNTLFVNVSSSGINNVVLSDGSEILDEVKVASRKEVAETEMEKKKGLGYAVQKITDKEISVQDISVENAIAGRFSNISLKSDQNITQFLARGRNMTMLLDQTGLIVVDGVAVESSPTSSTIGGNGGDKMVLSGMGIDPLNIAEIKVLKGLAATNKYGTIGRNGVIEIKTKTGSFKNGKKKKKKAIGTTLTYKGDALEKSVEQKPYIQALQKMENIDDAYNLYLKQRKEYGKDMQYFFDVAQYFNNWGNAYMVKRILSNVLELEESKQTSSLIALAYQHEALNLNEEASKLYERIIELEPNIAQTYRNLALAYCNSGHYKKAQVIYNKVYNNAYTNGQNFSGVRKAMTAEYKNLVALHKKELDQTQIPDFFLENITYHTRIVFEWSYFNSEFDIQIVNPQNRFFNWSHTQKLETARFDDEQNSGHGLEEFFITASDRGKWLFNLTYFGKLGGKNTLPVHLKVTTYSNFGKPTQRKRVQLFTLNEVNKKETILKLKV
jgi:tetratricopeptide (TPR) repeat protein